MIISTATEASMAMLELQKEVAELKAIITVNESDLNRIALVNADNASVLHNLLDQLKTLEIDSSHKKVLMGMCLRLIETETIAKRLDIKLSDAEALFIFRLEKKHPNLNNRELRICLLIRHDYDTEEIARKSEIIYRGMECILYRIHKKLGLGKNESIKIYLANRFFG